MIAARDNPKSMVDRPQRRWMLAAPLLLLPVKDLVALHPYQSTYFIVAFCNKYCHRLFRLFYEINEPFV